MRVLDPFHHEDHPTLEVVHLLENIPWRHQLERTSLYHHPFMVLGRGDSSDLIIFRDLERDSLPLRPLKHMVEGILTLRSDKDPFNILPPILKDREATLYAVVLYAVFFVEMRRFIIGSTSPSFTLCGTRM